MGCFYQLLTIATQVAIPKIICQDEDDIRFDFLLALLIGCAGTH
jgi:hypothetical protein